MASMIPTRKVGGGAIAGAIVVILIKIASEAFSYEVDGELASSITTLVTFAVSYFIPDAEVKADA